MFETTKDILYISLAGGFVLLVIFLCVTLIYLILILRDANKISSKIKDTSEKINNYVLQPVKIASRLIESLHPIVDIIEKKIKEKHREVTKKRRGRKKK